MTDDTLRQECADIALKIIAEITVHPTGHFDHDANEWDAKALTIGDFCTVIQKHILAFARAQQAEALREAREIVNKEWRDTNRLELMEKLEAQATAREQA